MKRRFLVRVTIILLSSTIMPIQATTSQIDSNGLLEDSSFKGLYKNFYFYRNFLNEPSSKQNWAKEWVQGIMLDYSSGFTQGTIGFGLDIQGFMTQRLDSGKGQAGGGLGLVPYKQGSDPKGGYGRVNAAVKMRVSKSIVKYGDMYPENPVFGTANNRLWPQTSTGFQLISNEYDNTTLELGYFTAKDARTASHHTGDIGFWNLLAKNPYTGQLVRANNVKYAGITYRPINNLSLIYYGADFKDVYRQHYAEITYSYPLTSTLALSNTANLYRTLASTHDKAGSINNRTWGVRTAVTYDVHKVTLAYQQSDGNQAMPFEGAYPMEYSYKWLVNAAMYNDFDAANEKSAQLRYDYSFTNWGISGLSISTKYIKGWDADYTHNKTKNTANYTGYKYKHHEYNAEFKYVVQTGRAKGLSFNVRYASHRTENNSPLRDFDEIRIITQYPFDLLAIKKALY